MDNQDLILSAFCNACEILTKYNTVTNELCILKYREEIAFQIDRPVDATEYITNLLQSGEIYKEDRSLFEELFDTAMVQGLCRNHQNGSLFTYRRMVNDKLVWARLNMLVPADYSPENPYVVVFSRNMPDAEAAMYEAWGLMGEQVHKVLKVNLSTKEYVTLKELLSETYWRKMQRYADFTEKRFVKDGFVHPDDETSFEKHLDHEYIRKHFREGNSEYQFYYRRKVRGLYRWVCLTVLPSSAYTEENEEFYYYVKDVHKTILKFLDIQAATNYAQFFAERNQHFSEGYYENLLDILSTFTEPYIDYYMLDLEKDLYINYKLSHNSINQDIPFVGNYSQMTTEYLKSNYSGAEAEMLRSYSSSARLQELLKDKMTLEYTFTYPTGVKVTTTIVKTESKNGIPTKALCSTMPAKGNDKLKIRTFGNFKVLHPDDRPVYFSRKQSKQLLAYLVDRQGYPVNSKDIVADILEKDASDMNAIKYVSTMIRRMIGDLEAAGYTEVVIKEHKSIRINPDAVDCDYYHFLNGDQTYWPKYHNEYMKEYSWAEETNAELLNITNT